MESDDVSRGVSLQIDSAMESGPFQELASVEGSMPGQAWTNHSGLKISDYRHLCDEVFLGCACDATFSDSVQPPLLDQGLPCMHQPATSLYLKAESAAALAKSIHEFLMQEHSNIVKIGHSKFTETAEMFQTVNAILLQCKLKTRIYRCSEHDPHELLVEFCRRSGDAVAFQRSFARARRHLLAKFGTADSMDKFGTAHSMDESPLACLSEYRRLAIPCCLH